MQPSVCPSVMTVERLRFTFLHRSRWLTLFSRSRPRPVTSFVIEAPPDLRLGMELTAQPSRTGPPRAYLLRLHLQDVAWGDELEAAVQPEALLSAVASFHQALRDLSGGFLGSSWAVEAWSALPGVEPEAWTRVCAPWTTAARPLNDAEAEYFPEDQAAVHTIRFFESRTRAGAAPWPRDLPPVRTGDVEPQIPRAGSHWGMGIVDLAPPTPDALPSQRPHQPQE
ncbi:hypothetical protein ACFWAP_03740 [Streptomyces goshikiensis]|uniref:hypothetical protein n=1 Tax=Streptomyces goshikiensis TaxID=1942 RepID=UPI003665D627